MRVVYWTELFWPYIGGVEVLGTKFIPALRERGYEVIVVTSHGSLKLPDKAQYKGIPIHRFPFLEALATRSLDQLMEARHRLATLKQEFKPNLIHINFSDPTVFYHLHTAEAHRAPVMNRVGGLICRRLEGTHGMEEILIAQRSYWLRQPGHDAVSR